LAEQTFADLLKDVKEIAVSKCLKGEPTIDAVASPREATAFSPPGIKDLGIYKGYY